MYDLLCRYSVLYARYRSGITSHSTSIGTEFSARLSPAARQGSCACRPEKDSGTFHLGEEVAGDQAIGVMVHGAECMQFL